MSAFIVPDETSWALWGHDLDAEGLSVAGSPQAADVLLTPESIRAAIDACQAWLAVVAIVKTLISLYPYLRVAAPGVLDPGSERDAPSAADFPLGLAAGLTVALTVAIGIGAESLLRLAEQGAG